MNFKRLICVVLLAFLMQSAAIAHEGGDIYASDGGFLRVEDTHAYATEGGSATSTAYAWVDTFNWDDADSSSTLPLYTHADIESPSSYDYVNGLATTIQTTGSGTWVDAEADSLTTATDIWSFGGAEAHSTIDVEFQVDTTKMYSIKYYWGIHFDLKNAGSGPPPGQAGYQDGYPQANGYLLYALFDEDNPGVNLLSDTGGFVNGAREFHLDTPGTDLQINGQTLSWNLQLTAGKSYHLFSDAVVDSKTGSIIPEPATLLLLSLGGICLRRRN
jgi:hypothetical protein